MGVMGDWESMAGDAVAQKLHKKLKAGLVDLAPTRVEVASHGAGDEAYVLFDLHYDNDKAQEAFNKMNHDWALTAIECGGNGSTCIPHNDTLIQASIKGVSLQRLSHALDKRTQIGTLSR